MSGPRVPELFEAEKVVIKKRTSEFERLVASLDDEGMYCDDTVIVCVLYKAIAYSGAREQFEGYTPIVEHSDIKYITALVNSTLITQVFRNRYATGALQGSYSDVWPQSVRDFPIRNIGFTTPQSRRNELDQQVVRLISDNAGDYQSYISSVLGFVMKRLSAQPEEADVVHDLLCNMAERMVDLNKRKQIEQERFLEWLNSVLHIAPDRRGSSGIESLTGRNKLENYAGDYQKDEPALSFMVIVDTLAKNRNRLGVSLSDAHVTNRIHAEYDKSLAVLKPIKDQLARTDALIDQIVYKLYGLTEEDIRIIQKQ